MQQEFDVIVLLVLASSAKDYQKYFGYCNKTLVNIVLMVKK